MFQGLSFGTNDESLKEAFSGYGDVVNGKFYYSSHSMEEVL